MLVASQALSLLWLRPAYFLLAALAAYLDSMQQALAVVLVLISLKIFLEAAGFEIPIAAFLGVLVGWRVFAVACLPLLRKRARPRGGARGGARPDADDVDEERSEALALVDAAASRGLSS